MSYFPGGRAEGRRVEGPADSPLPCKGTGCVHVDGARRGARGGSRPRRKQTREARQGWAQPGLAGGASGREAELVAEPVGGRGAPAVGAGGAGLWPCGRPTLSTQPPRGARPTPQGLAPGLGSCQTPLLSGPWGQLTPLRPEPPFLAAPGAPPGHLSAPFTSQEPPSPRAAVQLQGLATGSDAGLSETGGPSPTPQAAEAQGRCQALGSLPASPAAQGPRLPAPLGSALLLPRLPDSPRGQFFQSTSGARASSPWGPPLVASVPFCWWPTLFCQGRPGDQEVALLSQLCPLSCP